MLFLRAHSTAVGSLRQLGIGKTLQEACKDATSKPFGYLVVDLSPKGEESYTLRTNVFPNEAPVIVYQ